LFVFETFRSFDRIGVWRFELIRIISFGLSPMSQDKNMVPVRLSQRVDVSPI